VKRLSYLLLVAALILPPWRMIWAPRSGEPGPIRSETTWAGFHSWLYASERPTKVVAWDGPGTGGHVELEGTPSIAFGLWAGILLVAAGVAYVVMRPPGRGTIGAR
jgi:hypothetical protein